MMEDPPSQINEALGPLRRVLSIFRRQNNRRKGQQEGAAKTTDTTIDGENGVNQEAILPSRGKEKQGSDDPLSSSGDEEIISCDPRISLSDSYFQSLHWETEAELQHVELLLKKRAWFTDTLYYPVLTLITLLAWAVGVVIFCQYLGRMEEEEDNTGYNEEQSASFVGILLPTLLSTAILRCYSCRLENQLHRLEVAPMRRQVGNAFAHNLPGWAFHYPPDDFVRSQLWKVDEDIAQIEHWLTCRVYAQCTVRWAWVTAGCWGCFGPVLQLIIYQCRGGARDDSNDLHGPYDMFTYFSILLALMLLGASSGMCITRLDRRLRGAIKDVDDTTSSFVFVAQR